MMGTSLGGLGGGDMMGTSLGGGRGGRDEDISPHCFLQLLLASVVGLPDSSPLLTVHSALGPFQTYSWAHC